jgi:Cu/Ag efflux pump CusA
MFLVQNLIAWSLGNRLVVLLAAGAVAVVGLYCFKHINVEAYPDPAPSIVEVVAQWPGASAEEMERQVTIPLEVSLAGMPQLKVNYTKSLFGLTHLRCIFNYGHPYKDARQEVINRLNSLTQPLPPGVTPVISPANPIGEIYRYTLRTPKDAYGNEIYTLNDIKALEDWLIERHFRRVPGVVDISSFGGTVKRYEIQPDPERMKRFGITLAQLQTTLSNGNTTVGGDFLIQGRTAKVVRCIGTLGAARDPMEKAFGMKTPEEAAAFLREEEQKRLREIRSLTITSIANVPIRIDDIVVGGPLQHPDAPSYQGVVVGWQTRLGAVSQDKAFEDEHGRTWWRRQDEKVQGVVLMRKGEQSLPTLERVKAKVAEINKSGQLLPGVSLETYYDREDLVNLTTETVTHNLILGIVLVVIILMMFLSNVRTAVIVAINIPLALLIAFAILYMRGYSANLLSIGAVDFGIIVDSAVIMTENIYRNLAAGHYVELPLKERVLRATREIDKALLFSTLIMVCAFIPLFTMHGAEGELFGPMAQTYACALGGALFMALTLTPVLCMFLLKNVRPTPENILVRSVKRRYLWNLNLCLNHPYMTVTVMGLVMAITAAWPMMQVGREFMPELEEGSLWIRGIFPVNISLDAVKEPVKEARSIMIAEPVPDAVLSRLQSLKDREFATRELFQAALRDVLDPDERLRFENRVINRAGGERHKITEEALAALRREVPESVVVKLDAVKGKEFDSRDQLMRALIKVVPADELKVHQNPIATHSAGTTYYKLTDEGLALLRSEGYPEIKAVVAQHGRPDDGTDPGLFNNVEIFVPLRAEKDWPVVWRANGEHKVRTHREIVADMSEELAQRLPGIEWSFSQYIRDNVMEAISGVKADNSVKWYGPDLLKLEELAEKTKSELSKIRGLHDLGIYRVMGQSNFEFTVDKEKCKRWGVMVQDVTNVVNSTLHGNAQTQMVEGEKLFDVTLRWPFARRWDQSSILEIPVDIINNSVPAGLQPATPQTTTVGPGTGPSVSTSNVAPTIQSINVGNYNALVPRLRLKDLVSPVGPDGRPDPGTQIFLKGALTPVTASQTHVITLKADYAYMIEMDAAGFKGRMKLLDKQGKVLVESQPPQNGLTKLIYVPREPGNYNLVAGSADADASGPYSVAVYGPGGDFNRPGGSIITRQDGRRFIAVKFSVREDRDLASVVREVRERTDHLIEPPYTREMGGEFEQMEDGERRLLFYIPASLALVFLLLYIAFRSLLDAVVVLSNVFDLAIGGIWALYLTNTNFSMSAAVGFVSLFGVAIMDGLLMISYFNDLRARGFPVREAIMEGAALRVRPVTMTCLTAILGLLPAALSTAIGSQTQRPLAIVVVGGMLSTLFLTRYLMPVLYSFYGHREPIEGASSMAH